MGYTSPCSGIIQGKNDPCFLELYKTSESLQIYLQSCRKVTWRVIFTLYKLIAFVDGFKHGKGIPYTEQCCQTTGKQLSGWWTWGFTDLIGQLLYKSLLFLFYIRLKKGKVKTLKFMNMSIELNEIL